MSLRSPDVEFPQGAPASGWIAVSRSFPTEQIFDSRESIDEGPPTLVDPRLGPDEGALIWRRKAILPKEGAKLFLGSSALNAGTGSRGRAAAHPLPQGQPLAGRDLVHLPDECRSR